MQFSKYLILIISFSGFCLSAVGQSFFETVVSGQNLQIINQKDVNTDNLEFSPALIKNQIVFVGNGRTKEGKSKKGLSGYYDLSVADIDSDLTLKNSRLFSEVINSDYHEGPLTFSRDGSEMYFTRNNILETSSKTQIKKLSIFWSKSENDIWSEPIEILSATNEYSFCHPSLSSDGNRLYFSSNIPGGYGNYDIYYLEKTDGEWSSPINAGPQVNTNDNELFPVISKNYLFFSSIRIGNIGGLDIYYAGFSGAYFLPAKLLPPPVNSESDDLGLFLDEDRQVAWFSSSRKGGAGQDDLYSIIPAKIIVKEPVSAIQEQSIIVLDDADSRRLANIPVEIENYSTNTKNTFTTDRNGIIKINLPVGTPLSLKIKASGFEEMALLQQSGEPISIRIKPNTCFKVTGYTIDNENKAILHNVRVRFVNSCTSDTLTTYSDKEGRAEICFPAGCAGMILADLKDYYAVSLPLDPVDHVVLVNINLEKQKVSIVKEPLKVGGVITLENIYYDFNKSTIRPGAERELNELLTVMNQYPDMEVELIAHTDTRGDEAFNLNLSLERALAAKNYLISNGIDSGRIKSTGRGETQPRNRCKEGVNCTEEEHQFNRRTEVKILKK